MRFVERVGDGGRVEVGADRDPDLEGLAEVAQVGGPGEDVLGRGEPLVGQCGGRPRVSSS